MLLMSGVKKTPAAKSKPADSWMDSTEIDSIKHEHVTNQKSLGIDPLEIEIKTSTNGSDESVKIEQVDNPDSRSGR